MYFKILFISLMFILSGCSAFKSWENLPVSYEDETTIYVVSHGWHTGIVIPGNNLGELSFLENQFGKSEYYELGWGDKGFYEAKEITSNLSMRAIFWPTKSVMHVVSLPKKPNEYFPHSKTISVKVSKSGLSKLITSMELSFKKENDNIIQTRKGLYGNSLFFKGNGYYYITNTCNTWTAKMLKSTGAPIVSFLTLTASSVIKQSESAVDRYRCCP